MVDEVIKKQELIDAQKDAQSLDDFINGGDQQVVVTRLLKEYPTLANVIRQVYEKGGKFYPTLAAANADIANLAVNQPVSVGEVANGGLWYKATAGATSLTKSPYDPLTQILTNKSERFFDDSTYIPRPKLTAVGNNDPQDLSYKRPASAIPVNQGDVVIVKAVIPDNNTPYLQMWRSSEFAPFGMGIQEIGSPELKSWTYIVPADGLLLVQTKVGSTGASVSINKGALRFAPETKDVIFNDFEMGYVDTMGFEIPSTEIARSKVYRISDQATIFFERYNEGVFLGFATSPDERVPRTNEDFDWYNAKSFNRKTPKGHKYIRFYFKNVNGSALNPEATEAQFRIKMKAKVLYDYDVVATDAATQQSVIAQDFTSTFRVPSLATGGCVSFIDDDSRTWVYSDLYPFMKENDAPFGMAVIPNRIGKDTYLTQQELVDLIRDKEYVEAMNHTSDHLDLASPTLTNAQIEEQIYNSKRFLNSLGAEASGFVLPFGSDNTTTQRIVQKYHKACYDYVGTVRVETFDTIKNRLISRSSWDKSANRVQYHKSLIDQAAANNGWLIIATHVWHELYWDSNSFDDLQTIIDYIKSKGVRILRPDDAFQIFGNIVENDNGFKIQANGKIVGAT